MRRGPIPAELRDALASGDLPMLVGYYAPRVAVLEAIDRWEAGGAESSLLDRGVFAGCEALMEEIGKEEDRGH